MELTHTRDNCLTALLVCTNCEGWILLSQLSETIIHLSDVCLALWLYCDRNHSIRECHRLQYDWVFLVTECITCTDILETYTCTDITSIDRLHWDFLLRVHLEQTADTLALARTWVVNIRTSNDLT
ncbi:Uncharacterised protein [Segatella copri]|nr:Uncharacterised protein [Segatella copri]